jgi:hypothetical protein
MHVVRRYQKYHSSRPDSSKVSEIPSLQMKRAAVTPCNPSYVGGVDRRIMRDTI